MNYSLKPAAWLKAVWISPSCCWKRIPVPRGAQQSQAPRTLLLRAEAQHCSQLGRELQPKERVSSEAAPCPCPGAPLTAWHGRLRALPTLQWWRGGTPREGLVTPAGNRAQLLLKLPLPALIFSLFLSVRQAQLSNFNFIHTAAITPSGSHGMNTNGPLDCFKCRSEPDTCLHFVRSCSITLRFVEFPPNGSLLVPASDAGVCVWVRAEETCQCQKGRCGQPSL